MSRRVAEMLFFDFLTPLSLKICRKIDSTLYAKALHRLDPAYMLREDKRETHDKRGAQGGHAEHLALTLPAGCYCVIRQREYTLQKLQEMREIVD
jgi:hypothetical protein